jgi:hypothetical protein
MSSILYVIVKSWRLKWAGHVYGLCEAGNLKASNGMSAGELIVWALLCSWKKKVVRRMELAQDPFY